MMKIFFTIVFLLSLSPSVFSQSKSDTLPYKKEKIKTDSATASDIHGFEPILKPPTFPGGIDSLNRFIRENLRCPPGFNSEGRVILEFMVETDGSLTNVGFSKKLHDDCDKEALRILKLMPEWIPAREMGKVKRNNYSVSFYFKCN